MENKKLESCIGLIRKLPIKKLEQNLNAITNIIYDEDELLLTFLQKVDSPLQVCTDDITGEFIKSEYNRDGDSYRSPHSNNYFPFSDEGSHPPQELRDLEIKLNKMFNLYKNAYYSSTAVSSVYLWNLGDNLEDGLALSVLIKNSVNPEKEVDNGLWDSCNIFTIKFNKSTDDHGNHVIEATYKLTTTIILIMAFNHKGCGKVAMSGSLTRQTVQTHRIHDFIDESKQIEIIGKMVEDMENLLRHEIEEIYFKKTKEIIESARVNVSSSKQMDSNILKEIFGGYK